jgi:hypothetical protein
VGYFLKKKNTKIKLSKKKKKKKTLTPISRSENINRYDSDVFPIPGLPVTTSAGHMVEKLTDFVSALTSEAARRISVIKR